MVLILNAKARDGARRARRAVRSFFLVRQPLTVSECQDSSPDCAPWV